jgi:hypothetical protein
MSDRTKYSESERLEQGQTAGYWDFSQLSADEATRAEELLAKFPDVSVDEHQELSRMLGSCTTKLDERARHGRDTSGRRR